MGERHFFLHSDKDSKLLVWPNGMNSTWFELVVKESFSIDDEKSLLLQDRDNVFLALSDEIPGGEYVVIFYDTMNTIQDIVGNRSCTNDRSTTEIDVNFQQNLINVIQSDALIANERTWLAWCRTSINILICCFSFIFIDDWSVMSNTSRLLSNVAIIGFAIGFVGCFVVGYYRYRNFSVVLKKALSRPDISFDEISNNDYPWHAFWVYWMIFTLAISSIVYLCILKEDVDLNTNIE